MASLVVEGIQHIKLYSGVILGKYNFGKFKFYERLKNSIFDLQLNDIPIKENHIKATNRVTR